MAYTGIKRRVFISHYGGDRQEVDQFIYHFSTVEKVFTPYVLGANNNDEFINSTNPSYVMGRIREKYLQNSTVTIVLIGNCTHSRRYVDWEIKSSLTQGTYTPNGLMGIILPSAGNSAELPQRLFDNWEQNSTNCYAPFWGYPQNSNTLGSWIDDAHSSRTARSHLIKNSREMMRYNQRCKICRLTH